MMLDAMRIKMRSRRLGVPKDKLLEVETMDTKGQAAGRWRLWGTKGQVAGGGVYGVTKDKSWRWRLWGTKGQVTGGGDYGYQRTSCWRWRLWGTKGQVAGGEG